MPKKKKNEQQESFPQKIPAFLREDYPYRAIGESINDFSLLSDTELYEIKCNQCQITIRSQGKNIKETYLRLTEGSGCFGCGNKMLIIRKVDMKKPASVSNVEAEKGHE